MLKHKIYRKIKQSKDIDPDEIFIDSHNLPQFDTHQFEGQLDRSISRTSLLVLLFFFVIVVGIYTARAWALQIKDGEVYSQRSEKNRLRHIPLFAPRGVIYDRNGVELAWNAPSDDPEVPLRKYSDMPGLAHVMGYVQYPSKDSAGFYYQEDFHGIDGAEKIFDADLQGQNGLNLIEVDAAGKVQSQNTIDPPKQGGSIFLSIDSRVQSHFYESIKDIATSVGFAGGAGILMDIRNGEVVAMTSYPEYDSFTMSLKKDTAKVKGYLQDINKPFLDRATSGLYTPGSIMKPYMALGALSEKIIDPNTKILSTGSISVQNDVDPSLQTVFKDWKAHGYVDMRQALSVSSDVYFYEIGGGYKDQRGLGITNINKYMKMFGFGESVTNPFFGGPEGTVPSPEWKKEHFNGESWRLGNTYHTSIGQYGFQVTPVQVVRGVGAIATDGVLREPTIIKGDVGKVLRTIPISQSAFEIVKEGMRLGVTEGTGKALNVPFVQIASKSGTAELGVEKANVNSWITGFFPYKNPKYAFAIVMEKGSVHNLIGAAAAMRQVLDKMSSTTPEYFR